MDKIDFDETIITVNILRHWDRDKIERFAKHLLGTSQMFDDMGVSTTKCNCGYDTCSDCASNHPDNWSLP